jgi:hypothetical protein
MANRGSTHKTTRFWFASCCFFYDGRHTEDAKMVKPGEEETMTRFTPFYSLKA